MDSFNQQYAHSNQNQQMSTNKDGSIPLMTAGGQQVSLQHNKLQGIQNQNPHHHIQSYSFDYRQPQNNQSKVSSTNYASIGSINEHTNAVSGISSGPDGIVSKISGMNNNRLQGILNEGPSKKIHGSINQMGKNLRSFDGHQL